MGRMMKTSLDIEKYGKKLHGKHPLQKTMEKMTQPKV
jgi:hypothetical protein